MTDRDSKAWPEPRMDRGPLEEISSARASRRQFIKGVIASGAVASSAGFMFGCAREDGAATAGGGVETMLRLNVNGQTRTVDVLPNETLAMTLRYKLNLTGTKLGCDRGECGACTVIIDGVTHYSCSMLTHSVGARNVRTIEGLESDDGTLVELEHRDWEVLGEKASETRNGYDQGWEMVLGRYVARCSSATHDPKAS
jgi:hypothetical protein